MNYWVKKLEKVKTKSDAISALTELNPGNP